MSAPRPTLCLSSPYQLLAPLNPEQYAALRADIAKRGVKVPLDADADGNILDGHHRYAIAQELGIECPRIVRPRSDFADEHAKREYVIKLNLARRHLDPVRWGQAFALLLAERGVGRKSGRPKADDNSATVAELVTEVGVPQRTAERRLALAAAYATLPESLRAEVDSGALRVSPAKAKLKQQVKTEVAARIAAEPAPLPTGPFRVIAVDPPWAYANRAEDLSHRARNPYPDMSLEQIAALPVRDLSCEDAILWLWATNAFLVQASGIAQAWGFEPRTILTWVKDRMGLGDWLRGQTEHCWLAVRGKPVVTLTNQTTALYGPLRQHSRKPEEFYTRVESLCPGSKVELFARQRRPGWVAWGLEPEKFGGDDDIRGGHLRASKGAELDVRQAAPPAATQRARRRAVKA